MARRIGEPITSGKVTDKIINEEPENVVENLELNEEPEED